MRPGFDHSPHPKSKMAVVFIVGLRGTLTMGEWKRESSGPRVAVASQGCKLNQAEADNIGRRFIEAGCTLVDPEGQADIYVLNTCTVTHVADAKARQWLRAAHRRNPLASVIATGCYATRDEEAVSGVEGVTFIVDNPHKDGIIEAIQELGLLDRHDDLPSMDRDFIDSSWDRPTRTRAFIKVQEGCNQFCAFCTVPFTRGREANVPIPEVVQQVEARVQEGYKEVVLTGPQIGSYGLYPPTPESRSDTEGFQGRLHGLIEAILSETKISRLRISSIQPQDLTPMLLSAWQDSRLCRHVHMALQSGSDSVLRRMRRRYSTTDYLNAVEMLRNLVPDIAITTDVMVGFPGESEEEFEEGYRLCEQIGFTAMHVFPFSPRPDTQAGRMAGQVPDRIKKERAHRMLALAGESGSRFRLSFVGRAMEVLWEEEGGVDGALLWSGLTDNYLRVYTRDPGIRPNQIMLTDLVGELNNGLAGRVLVSSG